MAGVATLATLAAPEKRSSPERARCVIRLRNGSVLDEAIPLERHKANHLGLLHAQTRGLVEVAAGIRAESGKVDIKTRWRADHFLPGGAVGDADWMQKILGLVAQHERHGKEIFIGAAGRATVGGYQQNVTHSQWLWLDCDKPEYLSRLWKLFETPTRRLPEGRQPHLLIESAGSGGVHAYWRLAAPLHATTLTTPDGAEIVNPQATHETDAKGKRRVTGYQDPAGGPRITDGELVEWIERANARLINALGLTDTGAPVGDIVCRNRDRLMRLAGTPNYKTGQHARIVWADFQRPGYAIDALVGDLPDPEQRRTSRPVAKRPPVDPNGSLLDRCRAIPVEDAYEALTGRSRPTNERQKVRCPHADHFDADPSCNITEDLWCCRSCGRGGSTLDLASATIGGPVGITLRGRDLALAVTVLADAFHLE